MVRLNLVRVALIAAYIFSLVALLGIGPQQEDPLPPFPNIFSGNAFVAGVTASDGIEVFARVKEYQSNVPRPGFEERLIVLTKDGEYGRTVPLVVQPPNQSYVNKTITFYATRGFGEVQAEETATFRSGILSDSSFDLHFPEAPPAAPEPTPTPTPTITPTPLPTPVLPIPGDPSVPHLSRMALFAGIAALAAGGTILFLMRRRRAF